MKDQSKIKVLVACEESQRVCMAFLERSKTFPVIAKAMAEQWGDYLLREEHKT